MIKHLLGKQVGESRHLSLSGKSYIYFTLLLSKPHRHHTHTLPLSKPTPKKGKKKLYILYGRLGVCVCVNSKNHGIFSFNPIQNHVYHHLTICQVFSNHLKVFNSLHFLSIPSICNPSIFCIRHVPFFNICTQNILNGIQSSSFSLYWEIV